MKTILVPIDFSPASRNASVYAAMLASQSGAELYLLHVHPEPVPLINPGFPVASAVVELAEEYRIALRNEITNITSHFNISVKGDIVRGSKGDTIREVAEDLDAWLICVGRKGYAHKPVFGSTIIKAMQHSTKAVMIIPEEFRYRPIKHTLMGIDFTEMIHYDCLEPLLNLIKITDASLCVLHIETPGEELLPEEVPNKLQASNMLSGITYMYENMQSDSVAKGLMKYVTEHPADLLVMIPHHRSFITRLLSEGYTRPIAFESPVPLMVLSNRAQTL
jgi:nucleotide-binding universal stress UspA family protein